MKITEISPHDAQLLNHVLVALTAAPLPLGTTYADAHAAMQAFALVESLCVQAKLQSPVLKACAPVGPAEGQGIETTEQGAVAIKRSRGRPKGSKRA